MGDALRDVLDKKISDINEGNNVYSVGRIRMVRQYIAEATGLTGVSYFEKVVIGGNSEGYIDSIREDCVTIALTRVEGEVRIGDLVTATGKEFRANFSSECIGHVVDVFGNDRIVERQLATVNEIPIERKPIPIMDRIAVNRPLLTGITGIDLLYPIGRGQRQLIVGDKKTGKTQIGLDTIVNQKTQDIICIYVAIGKTKKEVKEIYSQLLKKGAMEYTIILAAFNDDLAPVLKITPYTALSMAYTYMMQQKDVLVVIDDLKRHADICREIALLIGKTPGRDAYPPDIFYSHSRLLEQGCQHKDGGSITILPICETKGGDITDYISTNIISITDGQIVLSAKNFERGQKPAIDYGLSVSRLGGAVQTAEMKKAGPPVRRNLLSYLEQREIFELANPDEMSPQLRENMRYGAKILETLKQQKYSPKSMDVMLKSIEEINK